MVKDPSLLNEDINVKDASLSHKHALRRQILANDLYLNHCFGLEEIMDSQNLDPNCQIKDCLVNHTVHEELTLNY